MHEGDGNLSDYTVLDIETTPIEFQEREVIDYLIKKKIGRDFHPFFSKMIAVGLQDEGDSPILIAGDNEGDILTELWEELDRIQPNLIVTFNGMEFDVPFLSLRSISNGKKPTFRIATDKWKMETSNHFDCMHALSMKGSFSWVSLEMACRLLGIEIPNDRVKATRLEELYKAKDWEAIRKRTSQDLRLTEQLFLKIRPFFGP
jgi:DNA polymerase elongation subunit (family B)